VASGRFQYEMQDRATGAKESWRQTMVAGGYEFMRVDLDGRETAKSATTLFHLALSPGNRPERLKFRHFEKTNELNGDVQIQERNVTLSRQINGRRIEDELEIEPGFRFWFPSAIGLALLCRQDIEEGSSRTITLDREQDFKLVDWPVSIDWQEKDKLTVAGRITIAQRCLIIANNQNYVLWLDEHRWPIVLLFADGRRAIETQPIRY